MLDADKPDKIEFTPETPFNYWCELLNCDLQDLMYALRSIGNSYDAVDSFLILNRKKKS